MVKIENGKGRRLMAKATVLKEDDIKLINGGKKGREREKRINPKTQDKICICPKCGGQRIKYRVCPNCGYSEEDDVPEE